MKEPKPIVLDGRTGEGGGQLVRLAVCLSAVSGQPIRITNVRGNRAGGRGGGLKAQHVASIGYLAGATNAATSGLEVGSQTLEFRPQLRPSDLRQGQRQVRVEAQSEAASTLLIFQAVLPFLLFAGGGDEEPVKVALSGGTNVPWSLSWEYADQVLLPTLEERFGVRVERGLVRRGWSVGPAAAASSRRGEVWFRVWPVKVGETLRPREGRGVVVARAAGRDSEVGWVDVSVLAPAGMHAALRSAIVAGLQEALPAAEVGFKVVEDTVEASRVYVLLVARSETLRWGRDVLTSAPKKNKARAKEEGEEDDFEASVATKVCRELCEELRRGGAVDEYLQDQLVVFQALAEGRTSFPRSGDRAVEEELAGLAIGERMRRDKALEPFGEGSRHTTTARWVTAELLGGVEWYNRGRVCQGVGMRMETPS